ncbi:PEBP-like protein [Pholiota conissans]|uniref:PEBP-like protein n=1 Tax=Pholiota conissans TaxID=109636 RepID=A0A9P5Z1I5_9AGAR|nr:PEBP-like protein [Pholiota conissans]
MFALCRTSKTIPRSLVLCIRGNATVTVAPNVAESTILKPTTSAPAAAASDLPVTTEDATTKGRKRRKQAPKRPDISLSTPRKWNRPLGEGVVPAYDLALQELKKDSAQLKKEAAQLRKVVEAKEAEFQALSGKLQASKIPETQQAIRQEMDALDAELETKLAKLKILDVQSDINLPWIRWQVNNAMADMNSVSHRYLVEQKWRNDGDLDLLMERLYQMNVVPDVLPVIKPSLDLHLIVRARPAEFIEESKIQTHVEPGSFVKPKQTKVPPKLRVNVFHTDTRLYTMLLVDPDVPDPENQRYTTFLHWMKPNIPLSATSPHNLIDLNTHTKYIPPHPQQGTPYHRYVVLLLPQPPLGASDYTLAAASRAIAGKPTSVHLNIPVVSIEQRLGFNVREFSQRWNLDASKGGGAHMFREVWDEEVSSIYKSVLGQEEPRYGRPPRMDAYAHLKGKKKYIL